MERRLSLEELRALVPYDVPGLAGDLSRRRVVLREEVMVEEGARALGGNGTTLGVRGPRGLAPIGPDLAVMPGRYRAWVLPSSGVALALEPLDDPDRYLAAHRASLLAIQKVDEADLARTRTGALGRRQRIACLRAAGCVVAIGLYAGARLGLMFLVGPAVWIVATLAIALGVGLLCARSRITTREGVISKSSSVARVVVDGEAIAVHDMQLFRRLVPGVRYRIHAAVETPTFEPVAPPALAAGTPYR